MVDRHMDDRAVAVMPLVALHPVNPDNETAAIVATADRNAYHRGNICGVKAARLDMRLRPTTTRKMADGTTMMCNPRRPASAALVDS
jgi:hypothetical protein